MPDDLDVRIRELLARAVADAPSAPELDRAAAAAIDPPPDRRRWWVGGGVAVLAAAALVATFVLVGPGDDTVTTPATLPSTPPSTAPPTQPAPTTTEATSTTVVPPGLPARGVLTAGPSGVVRHLAGGPATLTSESMAVALDAGDGRVIVQRHSGDGEGWTDADTVPLVLGPDGSLTDLLEPSAWAGAVELHDVEVVDGQRLLLYTLRTGAPAARIETLYVVDLATGARAEIVPVGEDGSGTHRLHLATTGLIVGESFGEGTHQILVDAVPGSPAASAPLPTAAELGLDDTYVDCTDCPHAFTVTPDGRTIMWINNAGYMLVARSLVQPVGDVEPVAEVPDGRAVDVDVDATGAVVSFSSSPARPPVLVPFGGAASTTLDGVVASKSPLGAVATPEPPASTTTTTTAAAPTTTVPAAPPPVRLAAAGDAGIAVIENGVEIRRLDQRAEIALLTPGGAVIFQPARTAPDGVPGDPLIWHPDGAVDVLLGPLEANQWYRLHDIATIGGVPTLLYGVSSRGTVDPGGTIAYEDYNELVYALPMTTGGWTPTEVAEVDTWEGGVDRLSLSSGGTVIGTARETVSSALFSAVVPGSPDAASGPPSHESLGLGDGYSDCQTRGCPDLFTISHDGESIVWREGGAITVVDAASGERRSWDVPSLVTPRDAPSEDRPMSLDVRTSSDGGVEAAISFGFALDETVHPAVVAATSPPGDVVETEVPARVLTFGP